MSSGTFIWYLKISRTDFWFFDCFSKYIQNFWTQSAISTLDKFNGISNFFNQVCTLQIHYIRREGGLGSFLYILLIWKYFYRWTAAFYRTKLLWRAKKSFSFDRGRSDNFFIEICRRNLVKTWSFWSIFSVFWP